MGLLIISKSFIVRESIANVFKSEFNLNNINVISRLDEISEIELNKYNFIFMEIDKDNLVDLEILSNHKKVSNNIKLLVLGMENNQSLFAKVTKLGVDGYMINVSNREEFMYAVRRIMHGKTYYDAQLVQSVLSKKEDVNTLILTGREKEVLNQVAQGLSNRDIASNLHITEYTVKKHISSIFCKLNLKSRQEAIIYCKDYYSKV